MKLLISKALPVGLQAWPDNTSIFAGFFNKNIGMEEIRAGLIRSAPSVSLKQVHGTTVHTVTKENQTSIAPPLEGDGLITNLGKVALVVHTADCIPLLASEGTWIGACHAGWRGVSLGVVPAWIKKMISLGANPGTLKVALGPSIGPCHFEVGLDVADRITSDQACRLPHPDKSKVFIDLAAVVLGHLTSCGIKSENISKSAQCTHCDPVNFYSYRRDGPRIGRMEAVIIKNL